MQLDKATASGKATSIDDSHERAGKGVTGTCRTVEMRMDSKSPQDRALKTMELMEEVVTAANLNRAYKRVIANKGVPGIDGMKTSELKAWLVSNKGELVTQLLEGTYKPSPVQRVDIPKPAGGTRQLGIPTVRDRFIQQAILQVLTPLLDPHFSAFSFGFRPGRNCHQALLKAKEYVEEGRVFVVDIDLEKFFDTVNHDVLMSRLARHVGDWRVRRLVRKFLQSGIMHNGLCVRSEKGTPQGGPLSPLLANLLLDDLDKELEQRGHKFVRYADDFNIYVQSMKAGERVMTSVERFLKKKLRLMINRQKSQVSPCRSEVILGIHDPGNGFLDSLREECQASQGQDPQDNTEK